MIFGDLVHWDKEKAAFCKTIDKGMQYLKTTDFSALDNGIYEIDGPLMYAVVQERETAARSELTKAENHVEYVDIQYVVQGEEMIGYARQSDAQAVTDDLTEKHDAYLYGPLANEMELILHAGDFAVFFPDDLHRPGLTLRHSMKIKKVVIKIHTSLLNS